MIEEKDTIKCSVVFNDERTHRLYWKRVWNKEKPLAAVLALNPATSDTIIADTTTTLICNNVAKMQEYGGVIIVNLYSLLTSKLDFRWNSDKDLNDAENDNYIVKAAEESAIVILAWGRAEKNNRISERAKAVTSLLKKHKDKLFVISDGSKDRIHPLTPTVRSRWLLKTFNDQELQDKAQASPKA